MAIVSFTLSCASTTSRDGLVGSPDPVYVPMPDLVQGSSGVTPGVVHYSGYIPVLALPPDLPNRPNLRDTNLKSAVSKDVRTSLIANNGEFHLKNKGITVVASSVRKAPEGYVIEVDADREDGILDGGHTYKLIREAVEAGRLLDKQYVHVSIRVNVPIPLRAKMAEGLNKATAVSASSLANRMGEFDWLKAVLPESCQERIAWRQNDSGDVKVEELVAEIYAVNYHVSDPHAAYASRAKTLASMRNPEFEFPLHAGAALDTLKLYERIQHEFASWAFQHLGKRAVETRNARAGQPLFDNDLSPRADKLTRGIALPLLGAFKSALVATGAGYTFDRSYDDLVILLQAAAPDLRSEVISLWQRQDVAGDPGAFGKKAEVWPALRSVVERTMKNLPAPAAPVSAISTPPLPHHSFAGALSPDEVIAMWADERDDLLRNREVVAEEIRATGVDRANQPLLEALQSISLSIQTLDRAIEYAESNSLGTCANCGGAVDEERVLDAVTTRLCRDCATS